MMPDDLYARLEVHQSASPEVITKAYRVLVARSHPDVHPAERRSEAEERTKLLNAAYAILSDPVRRREYDASLAGSAPPRREASPSPAETTVMGGVVADATQCANHPERARVALCFVCRAAACADCVTIVDGMPCCPECAPAHASRPATAGGAGAETERTARAQTKQRSRTVLARVAFATATAAAVVLVIGAAGVLLAPALRRPAGSSGGTAAYFDQQVRRVVGAVRQGVGLGGEARSAERESESDRQTKPSGGADASGGRSSGRIPPPGSSQAGPGGTPGVGTNVTTRPTAAGATANTGMHSDGRSLAPGGPAGGVGGGEGAPAPSLGRASASNGGSSGGATADGAKVGSAANPAAQSRSPSDWIKLFQGRERINDLDWDDAFRCLTPEQVSKDVGTYRKLAAAMLQRAEGDSNRQRIDGIRRAWQADDPQGLTEYDRAKKRVDPTA